MLRFVAGMAPSALMAFSFWQYSEEVRDGDASDEWVRHTVVAQRLADRMAREAGCDPDPAALAATLEKFAVTTGDNPAQVRAAGAIREALDRGDLKAVGPIADVASDEETRLLASRTAAAKARTARARIWVVTAFALGFVMSLLVGGVGLAGRSMRAFIARGEGAT
jgi:hypothetical protein